MSALEGVLQCQSLMTNYFSFKKAKIRYTAQSRKQIIWTNLSFFWPTVTKSKFHIPPKWHAINLDNWNEKMAYFGFWTGSSLIGGGGQVVLFLTLFCPRLQSRTTEMVNYNHPFLSPPPFQYWKGNGVFWLWHRFIIDLGGGLVLNISHFILSRISFIIVTNNYY